MADSWLLRDGMDRERMLDMDQRIRPLRTAALGVLGVSLLAATPWLGVSTILTTIVAIIVAGGFFKLAADRTAATERPEYVLFAGWAASEVVIAACIILTGGATSPALAWLAIPVVTLSARFSVRGVIAGVVVTELLLAICVISSGSQAFLDDPVTVGATGAMIIALAILSSALMLSDVEHRTDAVIDPLTGLLNRAALRNRTLELSQRSEYTAEPVGVIIADIDHFKKINDKFGHTAGDAVLKDIAYVMRKELRAFDLAYRIGGEEFLVLLPGANAREAAEFAEELHRVMGAAPRGGQDVTMSFGVSASRYGDVFDYEKVFEEADSALYRAKNGGRNQVCVADEKDAMRPTGFTRHVRVSP
ncbi:MAG: GGDEF domain-containing protein [Solirubrobacterales bacterium]